MQEMARRVRERASDLTLKSAQVAAALEIGTSSTALYWKGVRAWPVELLPRLAALLETTVAWLVGGEANRSAAPADSDLVPVDQIDLAYGLGGSFSDYQIEREVLHFPRAWLQTITPTSPTELVFARGRGDSMQPTINDRDIVLLDRSQRSVREQDAMWALTIGEIAMIKRLRVRGERVMLLSDNERVPADEAHVDEVNIVGRVIFIGRRV